MPRFGRPHRSRRNFSARCVCGLPPTTGPQADLLAAWCEEHRQMQMQARYHRWMHGWLLVHVPASFLLIILTGWHAVATLVLY